jgi:hypothetical protein
MTWRFPSLQARNLEGVVLDLPEAFAGDPSIVIVAFMRHQQREVDSWLPWLDGLHQRLPGLEVYELPAIKRRWLPARSFIDGGMRAGIPDLETRQRTLTAYTDTGALSRALRIDSTSAIALFAVSPEGVIMWSGRAAYDPDAAADLERTATAARRDEERSERWPAS